MKMIKNFIKFSSLAVLAIVIASCADYKTGGKSSSSSNSGSNSDSTSAARYNLGFPTFSTDIAKTKIKASTTPATATQLALSTLQADSSSDSDISCSYYNYTYDQATKVFWLLSDFFICFFNLSVGQDAKNYSIFKDGKDHEIKDSSGNTLYYNYSSAIIAGNEVHTLTFSYRNLDSASLKSKNVYIWSDGAVKSAIIKSYADDRLDFIQGYQTADGSFEFEYYSVSQSAAKPATDGTPATIAKTYSAHFKVAFDFKTTNFVSKSAYYTNPNPVNGVVGQDSTKLLVEGNGTTNFALLKAEIIQEGAVLASGVSLYCGKLDTVALATDPKCNAAKKAALTAKADSDFTAFAIDPATFKATLTTKVKASSTLPSSIAEQFTGFAALFAPSTTN